MSAQTFAEFYRAKKPVISFEVFPPKTDAAYDNLRQILPELVALKPDFMTVTYGAFGSTQERTLEIARLIQDKYGLPTACHLTCVGSSRSDLDKILSDFEKAGIKNIVALRGDPPQGQTAFVPPADGYSHADQLVRHIRDRESSGGTRFGIVVAGYPEKHVEAPDLQTDMLNLKRKVEAGADGVVTQLFYENDFFFRFQDSMQKLGVHVPIIPGLLPVLSAKQIMRITSLCGSCLPKGLMAELELAGDDADKAEAIGVKQCVAQAKELIARGVPGIHFYVLNKSSHMKQIMASLR
ncbi:MAG: methylenetetrahydrofolate reductase [NAD(P)H] [Verrucomicrobiota bacterium]|nr:methylenetetrahydrofolate reductase [NAD(P)H] [Verrucomicrobiota bacterium]